MVRQQSIHPSILIFLQLSLTSLLSSYFRWYLQKPREWLELSLHLFYFRQSSLQHRQKVGGLDHRKIMASMLQREFRQTAKMISTIIAMKMRVPFFNLRRSLKVRKCFVMSFFELTEFTFFSQTTVIVWRERRAIEVQRWEWSLRSGKNVNYYKIFISGSARWINKRVSLAMFYLNFLSSQILFRPPGPKGECVVITQSNNSNVSMIFP